MRDALATVQNDFLGKKPLDLVESDPRQRAWVEVSPQAVEANVINLKRHLAKDCELMAVVKADGYGHGAATVARAASKGGATCLGVATLQEGIELRNAGVQAPTLVLGNITDVEDLRACLYWELMPTLSSQSQVEICQQLAQESGRKFLVHLKVDTGMARLGCDLKDVPDLLDKVYKCSEIQLKGIYSHLALADGDLFGEAARFTELQRQRFDDVLKLLPKGSAGISRHLANSAGTLRDRNLHYDMVRVGLSIYGYNPLNQVGEALTLRPALSLKARVTLIRDVPAGVGISYGHKFITQRQSRLAVVGIGYADGVLRALSNRIDVLVNGEKVPQVGSITMDQLVIDITDNLNLEVGEVVTLLGQDGKNRVTPQDWSQMSGSIPWEILCGFKDRLPRLVI
ncbi:alanine racemase [Prochlorococcus sp. MIT 1300]|uniref:alanine racemase n=1 Tax=Prochlorococcus sp. MIT 1300 TaxID=3096218 RepID=UPI002A761D55|nr:alanine racemase [Prochlorococcus sp. MIT 1300]